MVIVASPWASIEAWPRFRKKKSERDDRGEFERFVDSFFRMITGFVCTFPRTRFGEEKNKYNFMVCLLLRCFLVIRVIIGSCARSGKYFATKGLRSIGFAFFIRDERIIILYSAGILFELIKILNRIYIQFLLFSFLKVISCYCSCLKFDPLIQNSL